MNLGASPCNSKTRKQQKAHENQSSLSSSDVQDQRAWGYGSPGARLFGWGVSETHDKIDPSWIRGKRTPLLSESQRWPKRENV
jgi:hypothetical protein